ncbi:hypothetical protein BAUCODRAFT_20665 [Baudoinia panamericana UAMH 10762]|uniref:Uncharacterized protein n=1 Tax=Baudoinia panamericana (strain UAMH 10762) TaxID=717646 RepID=M2M0Q8_BAUPA|nr:uncharacterized protein BAUCODRAFT_20665 [Baudoinia panamericana UAMH 10762]EMD00593.1 hypothetical protein BAUCODRAFT_20665 [Baudoinia panamericana UAMH 10762]
MPKLFLQAAASVLLTTGSLDVSCISCVGHPLKPTRPVDSHSVLMHVESCICMDGRRYGTTPAKQLRHYGSRASLQQQQSSTVSQQSYNSPLPQTQWSDIPLPYRPIEYNDPGLQQHSHPGSAESYNWRLRPSVSGTNPPGSLAPEPLRTRPRPGGLRSLVERSSRVAEPPPDTTFLYPQMSPYADRFSVYGAQDEPPMRSVSQPNTPAYHQHSFESSEDIPMHVPRTPTYPPTGRRRMHSASGVTDAAFQDERDFRLFVEATSGLGPIDTFRASHSSSSGSSRPRTRNSHGSGNGNSHSTSQQQVSPIADTPTTMQAYQHLAQMPQATLPSQQHLQPSEARSESWRRGSPSPAVSPLEEDYPDDDDELPDYAASQAQAHAAQRVEASRRAQELQRRWQESRGTRRADWD